jgi:putative acetyltransferase
MSELSIRTIEARDDAAMATVIRTVMPEFGAVGPGYSIMDPEVDFLTRAYAPPRAAYFVVVDGERVVGGGGIAALDRGEADVCELRKMYILSEARGQGAGNRLLQRCLDAARELGFRRCYIETLARMEGAQRLYVRAGFRRLQAALGGTGHSCDRFYLLDL